MSREPNPSDLLFVYGTLLRGEPNNLLIQDLGDAVQYVGGATVAGALIDLGGCPGFYHGEGSVKGEIYRVTHRRAWGALDNLEGFKPHQPERSLYIRERITPAGTDQPVWIYRINIDPRGHMLIANGDWRAHAAEMRKNWRMQEPPKPQRRFVVEPGGRTQPSERDDLSAAVALVGTLDARIPVPLERAARRAGLSKMEALHAVQVLKKIGWISTKAEAIGPARDSRTTVGLVLTPAATAALSESAKQPNQDAPSSSRSNTVQ